MKSGTLALLGAPVAAMVAVATPSYADPWEQWTKKTTDKGCYFYDYDLTYDGHASNPEIEGYVWTGACTPGQPISGQGTLYVQWKSSNYSIVRSFRGRIENGYFDGPVEFREHAVGPDGSWDPDNGVVPEAGAGDPVYDRGCGWFTYNCTPGQASNVVELRPVSPPYFPLDDGGAADAGPGPLGLRDAQFPAPAPPAPTVSASGAAGADGNVWKTCVTPEQPYRSGLQMIYGFRNVCDKTVTISFCMQATYEAAGDWNLCSQLSYKTYDIRPGARFEFPFTPVTVGDNMSDGRTVDRQEISASGAACIGSSPSVYVQNKALVFQRC